MTKSFKLISIALSACFISPIVLAQDAHSDSSKTMVYVKDSVITTKIKAKLGEDKMRSLVHVSVDTDERGVVLLTGTVQSSDQAARAVAIAKSTEGVTAVTDSLVIKPAN